MKNLKLEDINQTSDQFNVADIYNIINKTFELTACIHQLESKDIDDGVLNMYCDTIWSNVAQMISDLIPFEYKR